MKLAKVTTVYPRYAQRFYATRPGLSERPYAEQKAALDLDGFGWGDFWSRAFNKRGWQALDLVAGIAPLDQAWARERGLSDASPLAVASDQVRRFAPDLLWVDDYNTYTSAWIEELRQSCPSIRFVLGWCGAPYADAGAFKAYDLVLSCVGELVADFQAQGLSALRFDHAFEPDLLKRLGPLPARDLEFSFVGQVQRGRRFHEAREKLLEALVAVSPLELYTPQGEAGFRGLWRHGSRSLAWGAVTALGGLGVDRQRMARWPLLGKAAAWDQAPLYPVNSKLAARRRGEVYGLEMIRILARSKVTLNCHIDLAAGSASNMRLFEASGAGACLLTDAKGDLARVFEAGKEVVTYASADEAAERAAWLLAHPAAREVIAAAGQARTLRDHTFDRRAEALEGLLNERL